MTGRFPINLPPNQIGTIEFPINKGVSKGLEYFYSLGHRRIGIIGKNLSRVHGPRLKAYLDFLIK